MASGQFSIGMIVGTTTSDSIVDTLERWWHRIDLRRLAGQGEYYLRVEQVATNSAATPTAISALVAAPLSFSDKPTIASAWLSQWM